ncbi:MULTISPECIES: hypothetical protein [Bacillus]|uniref:hypothetical protein n=1 Tax=Bacillus TaxID=1386 RepID=UPI001CD5014D|nr:MULTISPECIES: hypothetical protein [Bacillus]MCA1033559.1 hypothetical protein [Bacillus infantis]
MFQNPLRQQQSNDPFDNMGKVEEKQLSGGAEDNPFLNQQNLYDVNDITADIHHVNPHYVQDHTRSNGTHVEGYWRDGDGDTRHDLTVDEGGGYDRTNPDDDLSNNLGF